MPQPSGESTSLSLDANKEENEASPNQVANGGNPPSTTSTKPRRAACLPCRDRKVRCSVGTPRCERCTRLGYECVYKGSNYRPRKPQHFEDVQARLGQLEKLFSEQLSSTLSSDHPSATGEVDVGAARIQDINEFPVLSFEDDLSQSMAMVVDSTYNAQGNISDFSMSPWIHDMGDVPNFSNLTHLTPSSISHHSNPTSTGKICTGDDAPQSIFHPADPASSPPLSTLLQNIWTDSQQKYFELIHPSVLIPDQTHFFATVSNNLLNSNLEFIALRLTVQMHGALTDVSNSKLHARYYQEARQALERVEFSGSKINLAVVQAWILISMYEFKQLLFSKAWISSGRASRFAQMIGLHKLNSRGIQAVDMNSPLIEPADYDESCRTFACVFILDRFVSIGTGLPMVLRKEQITTRFPSPEDSIPYQNICSALNAIQSAGDAVQFSNLSSFGKMVHISDICVQVCEHASSPLHQAGGSYITSHDYWLDHHHFEQVLSALAQSTSIEELSFRKDPILQFVALATQCAFIHLYKGAIDHGKGITSMEVIVRDSMNKCLQAALKIASIVRSTEISKASPIHPFFSWTIYCATKVSSYFLTRDLSRTELIEMQNILLDVLTNIGGRPENIEGLQNAPFPGITQRAC